MPLLGFRYRVPGSGLGVRPSASIRYWVPGPRFQVSGTRNPGPDTWYPVPDPIQTEGPEPKAEHRIRCPVPDTWNPEPDTRYSGWPLRHPLRPSIHGKCPGCRSASGARRKVLHLHHGVGADLSAHVDLPSHRLVPRLPHGPPPFQCHPSRVWVETWVRGTAPEAVDPRVEATRASSMGR